MTLVAVALLGGEGARRAPLAALVLPAVEAPVHRHHVGVAELLERVCGEGRADATGAHHDDRQVTVGHPVLDTGLQVPPGNVHRIRNRPLLELVRLTDVEEQVAAGQQGLGPGRIGFGDARTGIGQKVSECCHTGKATK